MEQSNAENLRFDGAFSTLEDHSYLAFQGGFLDVELSIPGSDIRLLIFKPSDLPDKWERYLEGLQREYGRLGVGHILDMDVLSHPGSTDLAMLAFSSGEVISGIRFHGSLLKAEEAYVLPEMEGSNIPLITENITRWLPDGVCEPKGLWIDLKQRNPKSILQLMARCMVYGPALLGCRYAISASPVNITEIHREIGMQLVRGVGSVPYPNDNFESSFGVHDLNAVLEVATQRNRFLLQRDWRQIQFIRSKNHAQDVSGVFTPLILDQRNPFHFSVLESLLSDAGYKKHSILASTQVELDELLPPVDDEIKNEAGRWVVYPWRNVAIETLGPKAHKRLRCDRNRNKIDDEEQKALASVSVGVIGLSTGHVIAHTLAMEGVCGHLKLADFDLLEVSNLNRIPASLLDIGVNKGVATARRIAEMDPYIKVEVYDEGIQRSNIDEFMGGLDIVVEECDSLDLKLLVREAAIRHRIPVLMATSDGGLMDVERYDQEGEHKPFHGLTDVSADELKDLSRRDKSGYALEILEGKEISPRLAASMIEIDHTVTTWAQLASDVVQGAAMVTTAVRRIATGRPTPSSRIRVNMDRFFEDGAPPVPADRLDLKAPDDPKFTGDIKADMLLAATFAPSPGNIQPWKIYWSGEALNLEIDRERTTSLDIAWRGAMTALGAACFNAEVVAAYMGAPVKTELVPDSGQPDLVARIILDKTGELKPEQADYFPYLLSRVTNRERGEHTPIPETAMAALQASIQSPSVNLHTLCQMDELKRYVEISIQSDRLRHLCGHLHKEMMQELVWPEGDALEEGIDVRTLGLAHKDVNALSILERQDVMREVSRIDGGYALGEYNRDRILEASAIAVLTVNSQEDLDYLNGGKALQRFWLTVEKLGLAAQPISPTFLYANSKEDVELLMRGQKVEQTLELKQQFYSLLGLRTDEYPILVLRLAYASKPEYRSLRRKI